MDEAMTHEEASAQIDAYVDGTQTAAERTAFETHVARCAECAAEVEALRLLLQAAAALPAGVPPARDLWPELRQRLGAGAGGRLSPAGRRRDSWLPTLGMAAAVTLLAAAVWLWGREAPPPASQGAGATRTRGFEAHILPAMVIAFERECAGATKQLRAAVAQYDFPGGETAARSLTQGLAALDDSILETRAALAQDPDDPRLMKRLTLRYQQKLALLNGAIQLVEEV